MTEMLKIDLPDGSVRELEPGATPADAAAAIGPGLAKAALAARVDGELVDLTRPFERDAKLELVTARDEADALDLVRHDYAHILAEAVQALWPDTQITFGPATEDGFYYDFAPSAERGPFTEEDLPAIEEKMRAIIAADKPLVREEWSRERLIDWFRDRGESFKAEWAAELPENEPLTVYHSGPIGEEGTWLDLCRGPHLPSTGKLDPKAFKLMRVSGAYWRGDQRNPQLSRIYGTGWLNKKQLNAHLVRLEEAAKRDHRKLGREMDLFHLQEEAHGSVFWHPKGYRVWHQLESYMRRRMNAAGYAEIKTPQVMDARQWERSGHWGKYRENMFVIPDEVPNVEDEGPVVSGDADWMALKPMNCPAHVMVFKQGHNLLSRPARTAGGDGLLPQERAARRAARADARAPVHAGRCAYLLHRGPGGRGGPCLLRVGRPGLPRLRLYLRDQAGDAPRTALRIGRRLGHRRAGAARRGARGRDGDRRVWLGGTARRRRVLRS